MDIHTQTRESIYILAYVDGHINYPLSFSCTIYNINTSFNSCFNPFFVKKIL